MVDILKKSEIGHMCMNKTLLINLITEAFKDTPYPGNNNIAIHERDLEFESLDEFIGLDWRDITVNFLSPKHTSSLCFMTPVAYLYYLPAYMLASIEDYEESDLIPDNLVSDFTLPKQQELDELSAFIYNITQNEKDITRFNIDEEKAWFTERTNSFSDEQKNAIYQYLKYLNDEHAEDYPDNEPQVAIDRYWKNYSDFNK